MAFDDHKNFAYSTVATAPSPATSGTSLVVQAGDGAKFPAAPFNATVWPAGTQPLSTNAEIVRVTNIATDTFTITRTQESSSARSIVVGDQIAATITDKTLTDIEGATVATDPIFDAKGDLAVGTGADTAARQAVGSDNTVLTADAAQTTGVKWVQVGEAMIALVDVTTLNVTSSKHGLAPKSPADATQFLNGAATPAFAQVKDSDLSTSDITTNNVSTTKHGFTPKAPNDTAKWLRGDGSWAAISSLPSGAAAVGTDAIWDAKGDLVAATGADAASKVTVGSDYDTLRALASATPGVSWQPGAPILLYDYTVAGSDKASIDTGADTPDAGISGTSAFPALRMLEILILCRTDDAGALAGVDCTVNNDTSSIYDRETVRGTSTTASASNTGNGAAWGLSTHGSGGSSGYAAVIRIAVPAYAATSFNKVGDCTGVVVDATATNCRAEASVLGWRSTAAITRFKVAGQSTAKLKVGSRLLIFAR